MFAVAGQTFKDNAYKDQNILNERLQIDLPQVEFYFYKMKSSCSTCSDSNLKFVEVLVRKHGCDEMIHSLPLIPWRFLEICHIELEQKNKLYAQQHTDMYKIRFQDGPKY